MGILIVDDDTHIQMLVKSILEKAGYEDIITAADGENALKILETADISLILMDYMLPDMKGTEICRIIKAQERYRNIPVIMVTVENSDSVLRESYDAGAIDYIKKPPNFMELILRVRTALKLKEEIERREAREKELLILTKKLEEATKRERERARQLEEENIMLQKLININPQKETEISEKCDILEPKTQYLVVETHPVRVFEIFSKHVHQGLYGLAITRQSPEKIKKKYNLVKTPFVWLTSGNIRAQHISPTSLTQISTTILSFLDKTENSIVLLEGVEYLITHNGFEPVLKLLQYLNNRVMISETRMIVSLDPLALEKRQYHLLSHEYEIIDYMNSN